MLFQKMNIRYFEQSQQNGVSTNSEPFSAFPSGEYKTSWVTDSDEDGDLDVITLIPLYPQDNNYGELEFHERINNYPCRYASPVWLANSSLTDVLAPDVIDLPHPVLVPYFNIDFDNDGDLDKVYNDKVTWNLDFNPGSITSFSTRSYVGDGSNIQIGDFIIEGDTPVKVLLRGLGPLLKENGVESALSDPTLTLFSGNNVIASNDDWKSNANASEIAALENAPTHDSEAAILTELEPGSYTVHLRGVNDEKGVGIIAIDRQ